MRKSVLIGIFFIVGVLLFQFLPFKNNSTILVNLPISDDIVQPNNHYGREPYKTSSSSVLIVNSVRYKVTERLTVVNTGSAIPSKQNLWVALIRSIWPYQEVHAMQITPENYSLITDEYGNQYAEFGFDDLEPETSITIEISYEISVNRLDYELGDCLGEVPQIFLAPDLYIESNNNQIVDLASELTDNAVTVCEQVREFYNYIGDNLVYTYNGSSWGAQAALGEMGADCTEYSSLLIALSRSSGIPARYYEGLFYISEENENEARMEHSWVEVYFPEVGWVPIDPTLGRFSSNRERYFAQLPPNHIIVTMGRNPSTLRGKSYYSQLYWADGRTVIRIRDYGWGITPLE